MKTSLIALLSSLLFLVVTSCGISSATYVNHNQNTTQVQLAANNFKVVDKVSGSAEVQYVCLIGGTNQRQQYENAYSAMVTQANLVNAPRALVHVVSEQHFRGFFPFYYTRRITFTAHVIEFTK